MPAVNVKILHEFDDGGFGWTEQHYIVSAADPADLPAILTAYLNGPGLQRVGMLAGTAVSKSIRASVRTVNDIVSLIAPAKFTGGFVANGQAGVDVTLVARIHDALGQHKKLTHVRGVPDIVVDGELYTPAKLPGYTAAVKRWTDAIILGYGWLGKDIVNSFVDNQTTYTNEADDRVTFTTQKNHFPVPGTAFGDLIQINCSRFDKGRNSLNTSHVVKQISNRTCTTNYPVASTTGVGQIGTLRYRATSFRPYVSADILGVGSRRTGKSFFASRGRARASGRS